MKVKIKKWKDKKIIEVKSKLISDLDSLCRKWRLRWYSIIKFIYD